tara:strand:+ start:2304 stop:2447 length:144 start_codon:yes stop_codon:yes gene_type:complete
MTDKDFLKEKLARLIKRREQAVKEKDSILALDLEFRIERTKKSIAKK